MVNTKNTRSISLFLLTLNHATLMMQYWRKDNKIKRRLMRMKSNSGLEDILGVTLTADWKTRIELIRVPVRIPILSTRIFSSALVGIKVLPKANMTMTNIGSLYCLIILSC